MSDLGNLGASNLETSSLGASSLGSSKKQRFVGLDLFRGIAAFAVVILHSDEGTSAQSSSWSFVLNFSAFAVPFFLAAAFYLLMRKLSTDRNPIVWGTRFSRLLIPYGVWSLIYLSQNILRFTVKHQPEKLQGLFDNLLGLILLGQAGFHLYFIPLLVTGLLLVFAIEPLIRRRFSLLTHLGFVVASLIVYQAYRLFIVSLNAESSAQVGASIEEMALGDANPLLTVGLTIAGYAARCLPYIAIALLLNHPVIRDRLLKLTAKDALLLLIVFMAVNSVQLPPLLRSLHETSIGYSAVLLALAVSNVLRDNSLMSRLIRSVGHCSFGIYLMHLLWLDGCWSLLKRFDLIPAPLSTPMLLWVATLGFGISWATTAFLMKQRRLSRVLFGA
jgi:surface polysaccharide O-acyltransferase-like enzyme